MTDFTLLYEYLHNEVILIGFFCIIKRFCFNVSFKLLNAYVKPSLYSVWIDCTVQFGLDYVHSFLARCSSKHYKMWQAQQRQGKARSNYLGYISRLLFFSGVPFYIAICFWGCGASIRDSSSVLLQKSKTDFMRRLLKNNITLYMSESDCHLRDGPL